MKDLLNYTYPDSLVATEPQEPCRVLFLEETPAEPQEIELKQIQQVFEEGDVLVINRSGVKPCRIFFEGLEILFLKEVEPLTWTVLFKSAKFKVGDLLNLPAGVQAELVEKGRPQKIKVSQPLLESYFNDYGDLALPPYIQKLRADRRSLKEDLEWYQTDWCQDQKSLAAPTASLHFKTQDLTRLEAQGVQVAEVFLEVGLGTFLPLEERNFIENKLHKESFFVPKETKKKLVHAKENKKRIWALGTTALRALESCGEDVEDERRETDLFIKPGDDFKWVSGLLTNFHQPGSSLLALVMAFYGVEETKKVYEFAVANRFRLFSYGDLSVWKRPLS